MKTIVTLFKIAMMITTLSFVMSCDQNNRRSNNTAAIGLNGIYAYGTNGQCMNTQTGQIMPTTYCQNTGGFGSQQCNGNSSLFVFIRGQQFACNTDQIAYQTFMQYGGCWVSCAMTNCSGQIAYQGGSSNQSQGLQCL